MTQVQTEVGIVLIFIVIFLDVFILGQGKEMRAKIFISSQCACRFKKNVPVALMHQPIESAHE
jgi:hypothetical protein